MTRDKSGPLKEISVDAILMKDKKYLPAFAKENHWNWRKAEDDLAWKKEKRNEAFYVTRSRPSTDSLSPTPRKGHPLDDDVPYDNPK